MSETIDARELEGKYRAVVEEMHQMVMQKASLEAAIQSMKEEERFLRAELRAEKARFDKLLKSVAQTLAVVTKLDEE